MTRRALALLGSVAFIMSSCGDLAEDDVKLRRILNQSERQERSMIFREVSADRAYTVDAIVRDDFQIRMRLSSGANGLIDWVASDDALAVQFLSPVLTPIVVAGDVGHPTVEQALTEGRWVLDPSGAPPMTDVQPTDEAAEERPPTPFEAAQRALPFVRTAMGEAREIREFNEEDIDYKPSEDPWRYPDEDEEESRYDLLRPRVPKSEDQLLGNQRAVDVVTEAHFTKISVFVRDGRIREICGVIDVRGHEDFIDARKNRNNEFLLGLMRDVLAGRTGEPIRPREFHVAVEYPDEASVVPPSDAHVGKLEGLRSVLAEQPDLGGIMRPGPGSQRDLDTCDRREPEAD